MSVPGPHSEQSDTQEPDRTAAERDGGMGRRSFLRTSAAAVSVAGLGLAGGRQRHGVAGAGRQAETLPSYTEFVPADIELVETDGTLAVTSAALQPTLEFFSIDDGGENNDSETVPFQFEPVVLVSFLLGLEFSRLAELGLGEALPAVSTSGEPPESGIPDFPTDRLVSVGDAVVTAGSYDADEIATIIGESDLTESDTAGVFVGDDPVFGGTQQDQVVAMTWSSEYLISGPSVELVAAIEETVQGERARLFEQNDDIARQVTDAGPGDVAMTTLSTDGPVQPDAPDGPIDYSPVVESQVQGYTHSLAFDTAGPSITATTVFSHASTDNVDETALSGVGSDADESTLSRDGRFVTVEAVYTEQLQSGDGSDGGSGGDGSSDGSDGGSGGDGSSDGSDGGSGGDGSSDGSDGGTSSDDSTGDGDDGGGDTGDGGDGSGPGFGLLSALAGLGGAGYLLSRRLGGDTGERR